jgi:hypothetical protein
MQIEELVEKITEENFTDFVRKYWSQDLTDAECDLILWNLTAFPFAPIEMIREQLTLQYIESGGNIDVALKASYDHIRNAINQLKEEENE